MFPDRKKKKKKMERKPIRKILREMYVAIIAAKYVLPCNEHFHPRNMKV